MDAFIIEQLRKQRERKQWQPEELRIPVPPPGWEPPGSSQRTPETPQRPPAPRGPEWRYEM